MRSKRHILFQQKDSEQYGLADSAVLKMADSANEPVVTLDFKVIPKLDGDRLERVLTLRNAKRLRKFLDAAIKKMEAK